MQLKLWVLHVSVIMLQAPGIRWWSNRKYPCFSNWLSKYREITFKFTLFCLLKYHEKNLLLMFPRSNPLFSSFLIKEGRSSPLDTPHHKNKIYTFMPIKISTAIFLLIIRLEFFSKADNCDFSSFSKACTSKDEKKYSKIFNFMVKYGFG